MPISVLQNLIRQTCTSRLVCNCYATDRAMECQCKPALRHLKMCIHKHIKQLALLVHRVRNGAILLSSRRLLGLL